MLKMLHDGGPVIPRTVTNAVAEAWQPALSAPFPKSDCCAVKPALPVSPVPSSRNKLWQLPSLLYCSIIGTCLTCSELRKIVARCTGEDCDSLSDLAVHERAVQLAGSPDGGGRILHKALDKQHHSTIKHFDRAKAVEEIAALWQDAKRSGDIPGAYWAVLSHRSTTQRLREQVFGDVHMLSHLVGAANRADIRRLAALEQLNSELAEKVERQQTQLREAIVSRDAAARRMEPLGKPALRVPDRALSASR